MGKQEIKERIKDAIEKNPFKKDIKKVSLFGSYLHGDMRKDSDVDVLVEFKPTANIGFFELARIKRFIERFTKKEVDLLTPEGISKYFREDVLKEAEEIYEER